MGGMGGRSLVGFQGREVEVFFVFQKIIFWWCGIGLL